MNGGLIIWPTWLSFYLNGLGGRGHTAAAVHGAASVGSSTDPIPRDSGTTKSKQTLFVTGAEYV